MKLLAVDTAEQSCSVALLEDNLPICETFNFNKTTHSKTIMDMVANTIKGGDVTIGDIDGFVVSRGPGSFTGLRIGISVVKGLAFATSKPSLGISTLDGIAYQFLFSSIPVCVMMDAKRDEVYFAVYIFSNGRLVQKSKESVISPKEAITNTINIESITEKTKDLPAEKTKNLLCAASLDKCLFAGSGAVAFKHLIDKIMGDKALFAPMFQNHVKASVLANIVFENNSLLSFSHDSVIPVYLRKSDAEINNSLNSQIDRENKCIC